MGKWMWTKLPILTSTASAAGTQIQWNLPKSNFISLIHIKFKGTGGAGTPSVEDTVSRMMVIGNGDRTIVNLTGLQDRALINFLAGTALNVTNASGAYTDVDYLIPFGRCQYDKDVILPAKIFSTLQLQLTLAAIVAATAWDASGATIWAEVLQYVSDEHPADKLCVKTTATEESIATKAGQIYSDLPLGHKYKAIMMYASGTDGTTVTDVKLEFNNGAEIPFDRAWLMIQDYDTTVMDLAAAIDNYAFIPFDPARFQPGGYESGNIADCPDSGLLNDARLVFTGGAASQTIDVVLQEYVSLA